MGTMRGRKNRAALPLNSGQDLYRDSQDGTPERKLLAAVLLQAWYDCAGGDLHEAFTAFKWAVGKAPMFCGICHELGASPSFVADKFRNQFGDRFRMVGEVAA